MVNLTYIMQGFSVTIMVLMVILMYLSYQTDRYGLMGIQFLILAVNVGLFYWQGVIRSDMVDLQ